MFILADLTVPANITAEIMKKLYCAETNRTIAKIMQDILPKGLETHNKSGLAKTYIVLKACTPTIN